MTTVEAKRKADQRYYRTHKERFLIYQRNHKRTRRLQAIVLYGGKCMCCGEMRPQFLAFDHMKNNGHEDKIRRKRGNVWWNHLIKNHPSDIQILCHNCNLAKAYYGQCPHNEEVVFIDFDASKKVGFKFNLGEN